LKSLQPSRVLLGSLSIGIVILDQASKAIVKSLLALHESVAIFPDLLNLTHVRNTGVAFGILNNIDFPFKPALMTVVTLSALLAISIFAMQTTSNSGPIASIGFVLVLSGATGNLIDRVTVGYVLDFIDFYWGQWHFWAFNVADSAITLGAILLIVDLGGLNRDVSKTV
jgi:signal peptidase II